MKVLFVAGFGPVTADSAVSAAFFSESLGLDLTLEEGGYRHTGALSGVKHFALWPLDQAAESCFDSPRWPEDPPAPSAWIEFDVDDVAAASEELEARGYRLLVRNRLEPWGQTVTRLLSPEGLLVGITRTPSMREGDPGGSGLS